jgi:hypothetical protein
MGPARVIIAGSAQELSETAVAEVAATIEGGCRHVSVVCVVRPASWLISLCALGMAPDAEGVLAEHRAAATGDALAAARAGAVAVHDRWPTDHRVAGAWSDVLRLVRADRLDDQVLIVAPTAWKARFQLRRVLLFRGLGRARGRHFPLTISRPSTCRAPSASSSR